MPAEESPCAIFFVDVFHGRHDAEPAASIFRELGGRGLEEDLDTVERRDDRFGCGACETPRETGTPYVIEGLLVRFFGGGC